jgi:antirestriction protein
MLARSPCPGAEEWAIHDSEGFGSLRLHEYESPTTVSRLGNGIAAHGPAFASWASICDNEPEALGQFDNHFLGNWESAEAYAEELFDQLGYQQQLEATLPESILPYVKLDAELFARDLELAGDISTADAEDGSTWVFDARS